MGSPATSPSVKYSTSRRLSWWLCILCIFSLITILLVYAFTVPYTPDFTGVPTYSSCNCKVDWPPKKTQDLLLLSEGFPRTQSDAIAVTEKLDPVKNFPRIIHQVWYHGDLPEKWQNAQDTCRKLYPEYKIMVWSFEDAEKLIRKEHPWLLSAWFSYPYDVQRGDLIRYIVLYHYGGIYIDSDVSCVESFDTYLQNLSSTVNLVVRPSYPAWYGLDTFISKPHSPFMWSVIVNAPRANRWFGVTYTTVMFGVGTAYFGRTINNFPCQSHFDIVPNSFLTEKYFYHHHASSWHHWDGHVIIFFYTNYVLILTLLVIAVVCLIIGWCYNRRRRAHASGYLPLKLPSHSKTLYQS